MWRQQEDELLRLIQKRKAYLLHSYRRVSNGKYRFSPIRLPQGHADSICFALNRANWPAHGFRQNRVRALPGARRGKVVLAGGGEEIRMVGRPWMNLLLVMEGTLQARFERRLCELEKSVNFVQSFCLLL